MDRNNTGIPHGGDLDAAERRYGRPSDDWLDLSTGINPVPYPLNDVPKSCWERLPLRQDENRLLETFRSYLDAPATLEIVAAPGTQALIQWLPKLRRPGQVDVVSPTYGEHAACWSQSGHNVREIADLADADADVVVLVRPNNPTGSVVTLDTLRDLASRQRRNGGWLVVDEAFADIDPSISLSVLQDHQGLVVFRSFGKFFGLAGIRLGFAYGDPRIVSALRTALGPWAVSGPALYIGRSAYADRDWQSAARVRLREDADRLSDVMTQSGITVIGGTDLFKLGETENAQDIAERLGPKGILVRTFDYQPQWLRFGIPRSDHDWRRLTDALLT